MKYSWLAVGALLSYPLVSPWRVPRTRTRRRPRTRTSGSIEAAISAVGPDGATYSIPTSDYIVVIEAGTVVACEPVASTTTQSFNLTDGNYIVTLSPSCAVNAFSDAGVPGDGGAETPVPFTLVRTADGGATSVSSLLNNPVQATTVTTGSTATLVFSFTIEQLGTITMSTGTVTVAMAADASVNAPPTQGSLAGTVAPELFIAGASAIPAVTALLTPPGGDGGAPSDTVTIGLTSVSTFVPNENEQICATFTPTVTQSGGYTGMTALFQEATAAGATGQICFGVTTAGGSNPLSIVFLRLGQPTTSAFESALATEGGFMSAEFEVWFNNLSTTTEIYNGTSFSVSQLATPMSASLTAIPMLEVNTLGGSNIGALFVGATGSALTIVLSPELLMPVSSRPPAAEHWYLKLGAPPASGPHARPLSRKRRRGVASMGIVRLWPPPPLCGGGPGVGAEGWRGGLRVKATLFRTAAAVPR